ncbi:MAG TPA: hypothetical protein VMT30_07520 [Candidatus Saccharimonadia bacterium]|nr:hypothetical protein [Candidatus Saccharimonadia bacterium]
MPKRFFALITLTLSLALLPLSALADDTASSAGLGPQTTTGAGGSNADAGALQPAGLAPLQATTDDSANLGAPASNLQAPAASDAPLQVLAGEGDGPTHDGTDTADTTWTWPLATILLALIAGAAVVIRDRRRFARTQTDL